MMLRELIDQMEHIGITLSPDDVADAIWLQSYLPTADDVKKGERWQGGLLPSPRAFTMPSWLEPIRRIIGRPTRPTQRPPEVPIRRASRTVTSRSVDSTMDSHVDAIPLTVHDPGVIAEDTAPLLKILRRLRRPHPSRTRLTLDVDGTVERWTETGSLFPVQGPVNELWLEAVLVVDTTPSAFLWRSAADDLADLLVRSGAFRKVRRVSLGPRGQLEQRGRPIAPRALLDPEGRTLVMVATDAVDGLWYDGTGARLLAVWSRSLPVVLVHWLPERLWQATAIGWSGREAVKSSPDVAAQAASPNAGRRRGRSSRVTEGRAIPITTLSPRSLRRWVHMLTKRDGTPVPAVVLPTYTQLEQHGPEVERPDPEDLVDSFDAFASGDARRLLRMLAGVPLSLPVIRLVRSSLMPGSDPSVVAEVLLSGLIEQLDAGDPEAARFGLREGVAAVLLENASAHDLHATLRRVADHLGVQFGGKSFDAALDASDLSRTGNALDQDAGTFALAAAPVLHRLGGRYRKLAEQLEVLQSSPPQPEEILSKDATSGGATGSVTAPLEVDLVRIAELPPGAEVEIHVSPAKISVSDYLSSQGIYNPVSSGSVQPSPSTSGVQVLTSDEFVKGIQQGHLKKTTLFRVRGASSPPTQLGETLLYVLARRRGMKRPINATSGEGMICRARWFNDRKDEAMRIARLLPKKTTKLSECVVLVTRLNHKYIYSTTNFVIPGYYYSTKIHSSGDIDLSTILINSVTDQELTERRFEAIQLAHFQDVRYVIDRHAIDPDLRPWLSVDESVHVEYVRELEDMVSVTPAGDRTLEATLLVEKKKYREARTLFEEMVDQGIGGANAMNLLAWLLATCPDESVRDGAKAIILSEQVLRTDLNNANTLDTLAAAQAAAGRFRDAVSTQSRAVRLTAEDERPKFLERLELYRANKPYVEE